MDKDDKISLGHSMAPKYNTKDLAYLPANHVYCCNSDDRRQIEEERTNEDKFYYHYDDVFLDKSESHTLFIADAFVPLPCHHPPSNPVLRVPSID